MSRRLDAADPVDELGSSTSDHLRRRDAELGTGCAVSVTAGAAEDRAGRAGGEGQIEIQIDVCHAEHLRVEHVNECAAAVRVGIRRRLDAVKELRLLRAGILAFSLVLSMNSEAVAPSW